MTNIQNALDMLCLVFNDKYWLLATEIIQPSHIHIHYLLLGTNYRIHEILISGNYHGDISTFFIFPSNNKGIWIAEKKC